MNTPNPYQPNRCLHLKTADGIQFVHFEDIIRIEADNKRLKVFVHSDTEPISGIGKMNDIEKQLYTEGFFRCHRSHIVSLHYIEKYIPKGKGCQLVTLRGAIPLAESKVDLFKNNLIHKI